MTTARIEYEKLFDDLQADHKTGSLSHHPEGSQRVKLVVNRHPNPDETIIFEHGKGIQDPLVMTFENGTSREFPPSETPYLVYLPTQPEERQMMAHVITINHDMPERSEVQTDGA